MFIYLDYFLLTYNAPYITLRIEINREKKESPMKTISVWHVTKTEEALRLIISEKIIRLGKNIVNENELLAHISLEPFEQGNWALDVIGSDTNEAWILNIEIPECTPLEDDPARDEDIYGRGWKVSREPIQILSFQKLLYISNIQHWEDKRACAGAEIHPIWRYQRQQKYSNT